MTTVESPTERSLPSLVKQQAEWYDRHAGINRLLFLALKSLQIVMASTIPVIAMVRPDAPAWVNGIFGALIAILEGFQQLGQFQQHWVRYRSTREALSREHFLFRLRAEPYTDDQSAVPLLAVRVDSLIAGESAEWLSLQKKPGRAPESRPGGAGGQE